jgi:ABC-2 type transport system ATP-binding protein
VSEIVVVRDLSKSFARVHALSDISLAVHDGELFGIVGPDGAGKTTLFRILVTLLLPESGSATVLGLDVVRDYREIRRRVGYMPGTFSLYPDLSVAENIEFFASVFGTTLEKGYDLIAPVYKQIESFRDRRAAALSGGMKQKLALCCALVHRPDILFLDEPTTGVDAVSRREFWDQLGRLKASGLTILVSTPYMDEAVRCDRVALMQTGKLLAVDAPATISERYDRPLIAISGTRRYGMLLALREVPDARSVYPFGDSLHYTDSRKHADAAAIGEDLVKYLRDRGFSDARAEPIQAGIEDSFMALMGGRTEAA